MPPLLELNNAGKSFAGIPVLENIRMTVNEGDFVSIIGYSGTGKSTLINMIAGLLTPDVGTVKMDGKPVREPGPDRGLVFQNYSLLPWLSVRENIALAVDAILIDWPKKERAAHVQRYIDMVKLGHAAHRRPQELSGGMRQRVALARTLAMQPRVLLLDEPLSALDALTRATLQEEIASIWLQQRTTVIWVTNDPDEALLVADRVLPLLPGRPATLGPALEVALDRPRSRRILHHDPAFKNLRADLIQTLLDAKSHTRVTLNRKLHLPDLLPESLENINLFDRLIQRAPRRRNEIKHETVEVLP